LNKSYQERYSELVREKAKVSQLIGEKETMQETLSTVKLMLDEALQDCYAKDAIINNFINTDLCDGADEIDGDGERLEDIVLRISQAD